MKSTELMIGDWVHVEAHRGFNAQNVKVETIPDNDGDNKYGHHYGHIGTWLDGGDNDFRDVEVKHLQPIPLTPEILKKNGFVKGYMFNNVWNYIEDYKRLVIVYTGEVFNIQDTLIEFKHVHELQHILKICGIEKEIIL